MFVKDFFQFCCVILITLKLKGKRMLVDILKREQLIMILRFETASRL